MIEAPRGIALIGDPSEDGDEDEQPARRILFAHGFAAGKYEVTVAEWRACVADGGCRERPFRGSESLPATQLSYIDAHAYTRWLSAKTGARYRLLSEAEWEYLARAGNTSRFGVADAESELCTYANHADASAAYPWRNPTCSDGYPAAAAPVGSFQPNKFGYHDMIGNVWEWVEDCWHNTFKDAPPSGHAWISDCASNERVLRGGAFSVKTAFARPGYRFRHDPDAEFPFFGIRVARDLP